MMKKIFILLISIVAIALTYSCSKTELMDYEGTEGVYFFVQRPPVSGYGDTTVWSPSRSSLIEFTQYPILDTTLILRVRITGDVKDYDRTFGLRINADSTSAVEGMNYEIDLSKNTVKGGMHYADIPIKIIRADNLKDSTLRVSVELLPTDDLKLAFKEFYSLPGMQPMNKQDEGHNPSFHDIYMNYFLVRPDAWVPYMDYEKGDMEGGLLGAFTEKKMALIEEVCKVTYDEFTDKDLMPMGRVQVISQQMRAYLVNQFNKGTPVLEDDGRLMFVFRVPWQSIVGVPYVPVNE